MEQNYILRAMEGLIREAAQYFSVISVTGFCQSGKSTLLKYMFPDFERYNLKDVNVREFAESDPIAFLNQTKSGMFIDEVQQVPMLLEYIQGIVDDYPVRKFLLAGSSNLELLGGGLCESLSGRAGVFVKTSVVRKVLVYTGDFKNTAGDIKVVNYRSLGEMLKVYALIQIAN